jgi:hypothetical protein
MKTVLGLLALFSVTVPAGAALVETFGYALPHVVSFETGLGLFVAAFTALMFNAAYAKPRRVGNYRSQGFSQLMPASAAFATRSSWYGIRPARDPRAPVAIAR